MITIAVMMYNEEKYILETLESIKYQIQNFGRERQIQLILSDDCSDDRTTEIADAWVAENYKLFQSIDKLYGEVNVGTCKKYADMVKAIRGERYVVIAGDDVFSTQNIFAILAACDKDILLTASLKFSGCKIKVGIWENLNIVAQSIVSGKSIHWEAQLGSPILNGAVYSLRILSEEVMQYMCRYKLLEDRARVYKIAMENKSLTLGYLNEPIILYRQNDVSVSSFQSPHLKTHNDDLNKLYEDAYANTDSIIMRWAIGRQKRAALFRGQRGIKAKLSKITPYYFAIGTRILFHWFAIKRIYNELMNKYVIENEKHLMKMHDAAVAFGDRYKETLNIND